MAADAHSPTRFHSTVELTAHEVREGRRLFAPPGNGPFSHLANLRIPASRSPLGFRFSAQGRRFPGLTFAEIYCDALVGDSGTGRDQDPVVAHQILTGALRFTSEHDQFSLGPGQLCVRDTAAGWRFQCAPGTRMRVIAVPRNVLASRLGPLGMFRPYYTADVTTPEARFLAHVLVAIHDSAEDLDRSPHARILAADACGTLFSGLLGSRPNDRRSGPQQRAVDAARRAIEENLHRQDLSPAMIADIVGVSVRTLHRSFATVEDSIMAYTRRRRVEKARDELLKAHSEGGVSEIATRWHFSDASHFIRNFRAVYGTTPAAYVRKSQGATKT